MNNMAIIEGKSTAYEVGYQLGYATGKYWPFIFLCFFAIGVWIYLRKKRLK
jgi:hypothetical protein